MKSANLSPLKGFNSFKYVYKQSRKFYSVPILIAICFKPCDFKLKRLEPNPNTIYFGVTAPKKIYKKAVVRNRIKRLLRISLKNSLKIIENKIDISRIQAIIITWKGDKVNCPKEINLRTVQTNLLDTLAQMFNIQI
jgi:ribonuclease P protein component